nr:MAG TPA: hypothetical protein [Caudoviricetes sp.]
MIHRCTKRGRKSEEAQTRKVWKLGTPPKDKAVAPATQAGNVRHG